MSVLRLANVYGPGDRDRVIPIWLDRARRGEDLELYGGEQVLDLVPVDLVVAALRRAAETPLGTAGERRQRRGHDAARAGRPHPGAARRRVGLTVLPARRRGHALRGRCGAHEALLGLTPPTDPLEGLLAMWEG